MENLSLYHHILKNYNNYINSNLKDRYINYDKIKKQVNGKALKKFDHQVIGYSVNNLPIHAVDIGNGKTKILLWSQMHGNESTTTKATFDFFNFILKEKSSDFVKKILDTCHIRIILMLNPDGATNYTRLNANKVDLNRDALNKSQPETQAFFKNLNGYKPDFCFNMHGQRTIFSADHLEYPATMSFLAPSFDKDLNINSSRLKAMKLIVSTYKMLQNFIPKQVGRYDDTHNLNCFGDYIQKMNIPTVLFEAGHFKNDYNRNQTRKYVLISFLNMLENILDNKIIKIDHKPYFEIPLNQKLYLDLIIKNVKNSKSGYVGIQFKEILKGNSISFQPYIASFDDLSSFFAHQYLDAKKQEVTINNTTKLKIDMHIDKLLINGISIEISPKRLF